MGGRGDVPGVRLVHEDKTGKSHAAEETEVVHGLPVLLLSLLALGNLSFVNGLFATITRCEKP